MLQHRVKSLHILSLKINGTNKLGAWAILFIRSEITHIEMNLHHIMFVYIKKCWRSHSATLCS